MTGVWIINGRCETCVSRELDADIYCGDIGCDCWCHDSDEDDEGA